MKDTKDNQVKETPTKWQIWCALDNHPDWQKIMFDALRHSKDWNDYWVKLEELLSPTDWSQWNASPRPLEAH